MAFEDWPVQDRRAWQEAFRASSPLEPRPSGAELATTTRVAMQTCYARWLVWLTARHPELLPLPPAERASEDRVIAYLEALREEITFRTMVGYAARLRKALALMAPAVDWSWMTPIIGRIERRARKDASVIRPFVHSRELYRYGVGLMNDASNNEALADLPRAERFRDGLAIAFLAARPLRRTNFIGLRLGQHIIRANGSYRVTIPAPESKTRIELTFPVPTGLVSCIDAWIEEHRPILLAQVPKGVSRAAEETAFWLGRDGVPWPSDTFAYMISRRTMERFGVRLTPHDFRHCAATSIAEDMSAEASIIRIILGHTTLVTAERHYIHAGRKSAAHKYQAVLDRRREGAGDLVR